MNTSSWAMIDRRVGELWVDPSVQRALKKSRVNHMAADFQPSALGILTTSRRDVGRIHIIDGQHRYRAAEAAGYEGIFQTKEYFGLTVAEEAALFRLLNTTEKVSAIDQFLVSCLEGDPKSLHLAKFLHNHGWELGVSATESRLSAIRSLQRVYDLDPNAADASLGTLTAAYGHRPAAVQGSLLEGLGRFFARYAEYNVSLDDLVKRLANFPGGPDGLLGHARGQAASRTGNLSAHVARVVTSLYNQRRRSTGLPDWQ